MTNSGTTDLKRVRRDRRWLEVIGHVVDTGRRSRRDRHDTVIHLELDDDEYNNNKNTGFILHGLARTLHWLKPELIEGLSMVGIIKF